MALSVDLVAALISGVVTLNIMVVLGWWYIRRSSKRRRADQAHTGEKLRPVSFLDLTRSTIRPTVILANPKGSGTPLTDPPQRRRLSRNKSLLPLVLNRTGRLTDDELHKQSTGVVIPSITVPPPLILTASSLPRRLTSGRGKQSSTVPPSIITSNPLPTATKVSLDSGSLGRAQSVRSDADSVSMYSVASAPREYHDRFFRPMMLDTIPASPATLSFAPTAASVANVAMVSPERAILPTRISRDILAIREELAPETYFTRRKLRRV